MSTVVVEQTEEPNVELKDCQTDEMITTFTIGDFYLKIFFNYMPNCCEVFNMKIYINNVDSDKIYEEETSIETINSVIKDKTFVEWTFDENFIYSHDNYDDEIGPYMTSLDVTVGNKIITVMCYNDNGFYPHNGKIMYNINRSGNPLECKKTEYFSI